MVERSLLFFVGSCANPKVSARNLLLCEPEHFTFEIHKKSNGGYNFSFFRQDADY
jgi:hypothetical protein